MEMTSKLSRHHAIDQGPRCDVMYTREAMTRLCLLLSFLAVAGTAFAQAPLLPTAFPELPQNIRADLQRRGCKVPQLLHEKKVNVIKGEFQKRGQTDWAILCEVGQTTSILAYWNASVINAARIGEQDDAGRYEITDQGKENIRVISPVGRREIMTHYSHSPGPKPPPIDHQGIDDALVGKASSIAYFYKGTWIGLTGSD